MTTLEKIVENLMVMPESAQTEVLDFVEYLKCNTATSRRHPSRHF